MPDIISPIDHGVAFTYNELSQAEAFARLDEVQPFAEPVGQRLAARAGLAADGEERRLGVVAPARRRATRLDRGVASVTQVRQNRFETVHHVAALSFASRKPQAERTSTPPKKSPRFPS